MLNEAEGLAVCLERLQTARSSGVEVIAADGGSTDSTVSRALPLCDAVATAPRGRASQMNAGAREAKGDIYLFLHADTRLPDKACETLLNALASNTAGWGRFDVEIEGGSPMLPIVAGMMNLRSRWSGIATGDQAIFVRRQVFEAVGGFPDIPLMEDIEFSKRLKRHGRPLCLRDTVLTSGRRWEKHGVLRTIMMMWRLRAAYYFGVSPVKLARQYGYKPREDDR